MKLYLTLFWFLSSLSFAQDNFLEFGDVNFGRNFKDKSKWNFRLGGEVFNYIGKLPEYDGQHFATDGEENQSVNGYSLSVGRDFYLGGGVSTSIYINGYHSNTLDKVVGKAARDINLEVSEVRNSYKMNAYEASIAFNYLFDYSVVDIQPFVELGLGAGTMLNEILYQRRGLPGEINGSELYDVKVEETFDFSRISLGVNFISYKGLMSYLRVSTMPIVVGARQINGQTNVKNSATIINLDTKESSIEEARSLTMISLGVGSYF